MVTKEFLKTIVGRYVEVNKWQEDLYKLGIDIIETTGFSKSETIVSMCLEELIGTENLDLLLYFIFEHCYGKDVMTYSDKSNPFIWTSDDEKTPVVWDLDSLLDYMLKNLPTKN